MQSAEDERRHLHHLRQHIDSLLVAGGSLVGRDPIRIVFDGHTLIVRDGMLISEDGSLDFIERLTQQPWQDPAAAEAAMAICLKLLGSALDQAITSQARVETSSEQDALTEVRRP